MASVSFILKANELWYMLTKFRTTKNKKILQVWKINTNYKSRYKPRGKKREGFDTLPGMRQTAQNKQHLPQMDKKQLFPPMGEDVAQQESQFHQTPGLIK